MEPKAQGRFADEQEMAARRGELDLFCPDCGSIHYGYSRKQHVRTRYHDETANGVPIRLPDGQHVVRPASPVDIRKLAERAAYVARRHGGYDFPSYEAGRPGSQAYRSNMEEQTLVVLTVRSGRVVGYLVSRVMGCSHRGRIGEGNDAVANCEPRRRRRLDLVWVHPDCRRQGTARAMIERLCQETSTPLTEMACQPPFTEDGLSLVKGLGLVEVYLA